jgi:hypothetical protein
MTHFGKVLKRLMREHQIKGAHVARITSLDGGYISRLAHGQQSGASQKAVRAILRAVAKSDRDRAELIAAHMKDESCGYYPKFISVVVRKVVTKK